MAPNAEDGEIDWDQLIKDEAIPDGENLRRLKKIRNLVKQELGADWVKFMTKSEPVVDIFFNVLGPMFMSLYLILKVTPDWRSPLQCFCYAFVAGWLQLGQCGCYHDLTHRMPFGYFWTRVLGKLMMTHGAMGEYFYKRHQLHHAKTGEVDDPKMRRHTTFHESGWARFVNIFFPFLMYGVTIYHQRLAAKKFKDKIKINKNIHRIESLYQVSVLGYYIYTLGFWMWAFKFLLVLCGGQWFNGVRMLMEHAGQDLEDEWNQSTFYESGIFLKIAFFGVPTADLHHCHHTYPKMPNYKNLLWGQQMNPVLEKVGVKKYTSFWYLFYSFFFDGKKYGKEWHTEAETKKAN